MDFNEFMFGGEWIGTAEAGGLSNETWLRKNCPEEFYDTANPWTAYTAGHFDMGSTIVRDWVWRDFNDDAKADFTARIVRFNCFTWVLSSPRLSVETRAAIAGWMLSNMLSVVPVRSN